MDFQDQGGQEANGTVDSDLATERSFSECADLLAAVPEAGGAGPREDWTASRQKHREKGAAFTLERARYSPARGEITLLLGGVSPGEAVVTVSDMQGRQLARVRTRNASGRVAVATGDLADGVYIVRMNAAGRSVCRTLSATTTSP
ncbi:MAG: T9SS type A sorting domain-containing protein [Chitinivibrionales bacterium]|nr:T9SS type A sorting domain-containing protein [Chitinivibrionales bacterium]MBD3395037.1 T9SS type A sorting domain-containing protein [Chitinivibrionales bacterium]